MASNVDRNSRPPEVVEKKNTTIYDIAKKANVSAATVSRVLNDFQGISAGKRKLVLDIIEELNFTPNALAQSLSNQKSNTIGIIVPDITNEYFAAFVNEFEIVASGHGYTVLLGNAHSNYVRESELLQAFKQKRVDAILFMGGRIDNNDCPVAYIKELIEINKEIPVFLGSKVEGIRLSNIYVEFEKSAEKAVIHLKEQGCKTAGMVGGSEHVNISKERREIFGKYFKKHGILVKDEWIVDGDFSRQSGIDGINKLLELPALPDTIFCVNDLVAVGALYCAAKNNIMVPQELMILGFDGISLSTSVFPEISTIQFEFKKSVSKFFEVMHESLNGKKEIVEIILKTKLVMRGSTERVKKNC